MLNNTCYSMIFKMSLEGTGIKPVVKLVPDDTGQA